MAEAKRPLVDLLYRVAVKQSPYGESAWTQNFLYQHGLYGNLSADTVDEAYRKSKCTLFMAPGNRCTLTKAVRNGVALEEIERGEVIGTFRPVVAVPGGSNAPSIKFLAAMIHADTEWLYDWTGTVPADLVCSPADLATVATVAMVLAVELAKYTSALMFTADEFSHRLALFSMLSARAVRCRCCSATALYGTEALCLGNDCHFRPRAAFRGAHVLPVHRPPSDEVCAVHVTEPRVLRAQHPIPIGGIITVANAANPFGQSQASAPHPKHVYPMYTFRCEGVEAIITAGHRIKTTTTIDVDDPALTADLQRFLDTVLTGATTPISTRRMLEARTNAHNNFDGGPIPTEVWPCPIPADIHDALLDLPMADTVDFINKHYVRGMEKAGWPAVLLDLALDLRERPVPALAATAKQAAEAVQRLYGRPIETFA